MDSPNLNNTSKKSMIRAIMGGSIGNMLEWFDYMVYSQFAIYLQAAIFPAEDKLTGLIMTFVVFMIGYFIRPLGSVVLGNMADKHGRLKIMMLTVILMGIGTTMLGCVPSYEKIGILAPILVAAARLIQGFAVGGEWGTNVTYLSEFSTPNNKGLMASWSTVSCGIGCLIGSMLGLFLSSVMAEEVIAAWGWRIPFITGLLIVIFGFYARRNCDETPVFEEQKNSGEIAEQPLKEAFKDNTNKKNILFVFLFQGGAGIMYLMIFTYFITHLSLLGHDANFGFFLSTASAILYTIAVPIFAHISDKTGRKPHMVWGQVGTLLLLYPAFKVMSVSQSEVVITVIVLLMVLMVSWYNGPQNIIMAEIFPAKVRATSFSIGYNFASCFITGPALTLFTLLIKVTGNDMAPLLYVMPVAAIGLFATIFMYKESYKNPL